LFWMSILLLSSWHVFLNFIILWMNHQIPWPLKYLGLWIFINFLAYNFSYYISRKHAKNNSNIKVLIHYTKVLTCPIQPCKRFLLPFLSFSFPHFMIQFKF
jgi:hypothetical protein